MVQQRCFLQWFSYFVGKTNERKFKEKSSHKKNINEIVFFREIKKSRNQ